MICTNHRHVTSWHDHVCVGLTHLITMDLHQKEIQGFFNIPVDNLRASPFLLQYIQEEVISKNRCDTHASFLSLLLFLVLTLTNLMLFWYFSTLVHLLCVILAPLPLSLLLIGWLGWEQVGGASVFSLLISFVNKSQSEGISCIFLTSFFDTCTTSSMSIHPVTVFILARLFCWR